jgi:hypothetical protein
LTYPENQMPSAVAQPFPWAEDWMGAPRFARYLAECSGDREKAIALYEWNLALGQAMMRDIAHFEIALRNAYDRTMRHRWKGQHWLIDPASPVLVPLWARRRGHGTDLNKHNRDSISAAIARAGSQPPSPDELVADLTLGFWRHLTDSAHEKTLWVPYLYHAWPKKTARAAVDHTIGEITQVRNRIAHHEPLFAVSQGSGGILALQQDMIGLLHMLLPDLATYVQQSSTVASVFSTKP